MEGFKPLSANWDREQRNEENRMLEELYEGIEGDIDVSRIPVGSIDGTLLQDGSISPSKTSFFEGIGDNLFDGSYYNGMLIYNRPSGRIYVSENYDDFLGKTAIIEIDPGKSYHLQIEEPSKSNLLRVALHNRLASFESRTYLDETVFTNVAGDDDREVYIRAKENHRYVYIYVSNDGQEPRISLKEIYIPRGAIEPINKGEVTPEHTSFFNINEKNLFDGLYRNNITRISGGGIRYSENDLYRTAVIPIEVGETYTVTKYNGGDRFTVMLSDRIPTKADGDIESLYEYFGGNSPEKKSHTFTNTFGAEYLFVQTNFASENVPILQVEIGDTETRYVPRYSIPSSMIDGGVKGELDRDNIFNFFVNLNQLYRFEGELEDFYDSPTNLSVEEYHNKFQDLIDQHEDIASYQSEGEAEGGYPLYSYKIKPPNYTMGATNDAGTIGAYDVPLPKIIFVTGIHGYERSTTMSMYYFFKELLENPTDNELFEFIKTSIHFEVLPLSNPSGWTENTYHNTNDININREFPPNREPNQKESIIIKDFVDRNLDMDFFVDFHNINSSIRKERLGFSLTNNDMLAKTLNNMYRSIGRSWQKEISTFPQNLDYVWAYNAQSNNGTVGHYTEVIHGIPSVLMEVPNQIEWTGGGKFGEPTVRLGVEYIVNSIIGMLRTKY